MRISSSSPPYSLPALLVRGDAARNCRCKGSSVVDRRVYLLGTGFGDWERWWRRHLGLGLTMTTSLSSCSSAIVVFLSPMVSSSSSNPARRSGDAPARLHDVFAAHPAAFPRRETAPARAGQTLSTPPPAACVCAADCLGAARGCPAGCLGA
ncbi:hypothetical protein GUJ93_ZPchr0013g34346 [Zizania palustris]|uniref:Uncharacterized protein n=1 Tax=Zizania palustris TaxID=103762 RepID=A0A8J5X1S9_ZIZPA|nr:hypothetical protein GUJ93_ZPchr0013g34346 [Zizania palustris]